MNHTLAQKLLHAMQQRGFWSLAMRPLSWLYGALAARQRRRALAAQVTLPVPVVVVGNVIQIPERYERHRWMTHLLFDPQQLFGLMTLACVCHATLVDWPPGGLLKQRTELFFERCIAPGVAVADQIYVVT